MRNQVTADAAVFTTILLDHGHPRRFAHHIERLRQWRHTSWPEPDPAHIRQLLTQQYRQYVQQGYARGRIILSADGITVSVEKYLPPTAPFPLYIKPVDAPLGAIKRWPFINLGTPKNGDIVLVDTKTNIVYEGNKTTVFIRTNGILTTPPLDGAILPGISRAHVLSVLKRLNIPFQERSIYLEELLRSEVFVSNALIGLRRAVVRPTSRTV